MEIAITITYSILNILITFLGIVLLRYFAQRKVENSSYNPAIFVYAIWFVFSLFILSYLYSLISSSFFSYSNPMRDALMNIYAISTIIIELFIVSILVMYFYKINYEDSIFMTLQVMAIQILMRIILTNILAILFNLTTGGYIYFYFFQN